MKNESSTSQLSVNGTDYTFYCLLVCSPNERTSGEPLKCKGKVKRGLCLSTEPSSKVVLQAFTSSSVSLCCRRSAMELAGPRSLLQSLLQCLDSPMCRESLLPSLVAVKHHPSSDGPVSACWGPCAYRALHASGIYTQMKFGVFGYDPGITSTKSMDFPQIYFSIMS